MTSDQAGAAFAARRVEAAVPWEPWLTNAVKNQRRPAAPAHHGNGHGTGIHRARRALRDAAAIGPADV
ncbi:hypothetical protein [Actinomadura decatromicini]|uniref:Uncharacterized protein n=1 Tax=Actinomadura decatromicini TaxID=2604572 RepID=A0A5D3FAW1_9ACTN|nr:hypothetical protein [Actinomadura decatromicini]TYK44525.1 hypothetical protein FXF68_34240 [Actinomadura decatromicini]